MEIKAFTSAISAYASSKYDKNQTSKSSPATVAKNVDKIEFSVLKVKSEKELKADIAQSVRESASDDRINELRNQYLNGNTKISSEKIAKSILGL